MIWSGGPRISIFALRVSIFLSLLLTCGQSDGKGFRCLPSVRETQIRLLEDSEGVQLEVINPMGFAMMPFMEGPLSQFQIPFLKMQAEDLKGLGDGFKMRWSQKACEGGDWSRYLMICRGEASLRPENPNIKPLSLATTVVTEEGLEPSQNSKKVKLQIVAEAAGNYYFLAMSFFLSKCETF